MRAGKEEIIKLLMENGYGKKHVNMYQNMIAAHQMMQLADELTPLTMHPKDLTMTITDGRLEIEEHNGADWSPEILMNVMLHQILDMFIGLYETLSADNINKQFIRKTLEAMHDAVGSFGRMAFSDNEEEPITASLDKLSDIKAMIDDLLGGGEVVYQDKDMTMIQKRESADDEELLANTMEVNIDAMLRALNPNDTMEAQFIKQLEQAKVDPECKGVRTERLPDDLMARYQKELARSQNDDSNLETLLGDE